MTKLPMFDARGGSLVSFVGLERTVRADLDESSRFACSLVVVKWGQQVLLGFNVDRRQWELPGGAVEAGESAHDAALRELVEETGISAEEATPVARAEFMFDSKATVYIAAVFAVILVNAPELIESDELSEFKWWDPASELCDGLSPLDAEVVRRCLALV
jgi:8-oxo-dGTP diphosphatase